MTNEKKIIAAKVGLLKLAEQLGNVSQVCKVMGYSRDSSVNAAISDVHDAVISSQTPVSCKSVA